MLAPSPNALHILLNLCQECAENNELVYNEAQNKEYGVFKEPAGFKDLYVPRFHLKDSVLGCVDKQKYLGVYISDDQKDGCNTCISRWIKAVYTHGNIIFNKFKHCSKVVTVKLFISYCNSSIVLNCGATICRNLLVKY